MWVMKLAKNRIRYRKGSSLYDREAEMGRFERQAEPLQSDRARLLKLIKERKQAWPTSAPPSAPSGVLKNDGKQD